MLDDIVKLGRGDQVPADAVVVEGTAQVNESLLTGESDLIKKEPGSELMSGSFLDSGLVYARVVHVGADNYVAKINNEAKYVKKVNSEIMSALNAIVRFASIIMVPLGLALFFASLHDAYIAWADAGGAASFTGWLLSSGEAWPDVSASILSTVGALLGMIPQGLVLLTSSVLAIATVRLARKKVLAQQLYCIETLARVDVLCLDKTGTITSGRMEVEGVYPIAPVPGRRRGRFGRRRRRGARRLRARQHRRGHLGRRQRDLQGAARLLRRPPRAARPPRARGAVLLAKKWSGASFEGASYVMGAAQFVLSPSELARVEDAVAHLADTCRVLVVARWTASPTMTRWPGRRGPWGSWPSATRSAPRRPRPSATSATRA